MSDTKDIDAAKANAEKAGATAAKARIKAIMTAEAATGRDALAKHLAYDTDMPAEAAVAILAVADKAPAADAKADPKPETPAEDYAADRAAAARLAKPATTTPATKATAEQISAGWDKARKKLGLAG